MSDTFTHSAFKFRCHRNATCTELQHPQLRLTPILMLPVLSSCDCMQTCRCKPRWTMGYTLVWHPPDGQRTEQLFTELSGVTVTYAVWHRVKCSKSIHKPHLLPGNFSFLSSAAVSFSLSLSVQQQIDEKRNC